MLIAELLLLIGVAFVCTPWVWGEDWQQIAHVVFGLLLLFIVVY